MSLTDSSAAIGQSSRLWRYGIAVVCVVVALVVRLSLDPVVGTGGRELFTFILAILVATRVGGRGPGLLATALSVPSAQYFLIEPRFSFTVADPLGWWTLVVLAVTGACISLLIGQPAPPSPPVKGRKSDSFFLRRTVLFASAFLVLAILTRLLYADFASEKDRQNWVTHSYQVLNAIGALKSILQDAETGVRGYMLMGDESYLEPFQSALREEQSARQTLRKLTADNPVQQKSMDTLDKLVEAKFAVLQTGIERRRKGGLNAVLAVRSGEGKQIMEECRVALGAMQQEDRRLLASRTQEAERQSIKLHWVLGLGSASLMLLLFVAGAVIERDSRIREFSRLVIRQSEERLRLALDAANAGTWEWDLETNENVWSEELWTLYGIEPHSRTPSYDAWREIIHPDDRANAEQAVAQAARAGGELNVEFRVAGATERWLLARGQPLRNGDGHPGRYVGIVLDITRKKQAEQALQAREQDLRRFAEFAPVSIAMFDRDMRYLAASHRFRDDYSLGDRELVGHSHYEIFPEIPEQWREIHRRCLAGAVERHPGERFLRSDGAEQWVRWEIQPWHQADGSIGGIVLFSEDITGQRQAEQARRESEERLRLAQQVARVGTFEWNIQTGVDTWTPELEAMYGLPPGGFAETRQTWEDFIHPEDRPEAMRQRQRAMETGEFDAEFRVVWPDGTLRWLAGRGRVFWDEAGKPLRLVGVNIDITEAMEASEALRRSEAGLIEAQRVAHVGSWHRDLKTNAMTCSEELYRIWGLDPKLPFPSLKDQGRFYTPESFGRLNAAVQTALRTGAGYELDLELVRADGTSIWVTTRGEVVRDAAGEIVALHGTLQDVTRRKRAEDEILASSAVIQAIGRVFSEAISCETEEELGRACLAVAEKLTGSKFSFIGEINNATGRLDDIAISDPGWDACQMDRPSGQKKAPSNLAIHGIYGRVLLDGKGFYTNDPPSHPDCIGVPEGHPPLKAFLGVPLVRSGKTIGMIAVGNREGGYRPGDLEALEALTPAIVQAFMRKRAENALRESEAQFRTLANGIPQLCWMANADGWLFWYNQRWYEYTGTSPEQMEGWGWQSVHDPALLPKILDRWKASIATGEPLDVVFRLRGWDGEFRPFLTRVMPLRDANGQVVRWFGTSTDISEQQMTEEALRQASEQRRLALEAAELGAWDYRFKTGEVFWDDACRNMFGFPTGSQMDYDEATSRIHVEDRAATREAVNQVLAGARGGAYHREFRVVWLDSSVHWIASHGRANFEEDGLRRKPVQFTGVNMDITERKQAELEIRQLNSQLEQRVRRRTAQLETANKELEAFAYSVSHDLRAPLRGIDGWSLALAEDYADKLDEGAHVYLNRVRSETQRMGRLIDDLLQLSRVTRAEMQLVPVDLTATAQSIAARLSESNPGRHIEFIIEPGLSALGDARLLEIALTNLLENAVKFTRTRSPARIEFGRSDDQGQPTFYVRDNGVGFEEAYAHKLFRAFQRLHKTSEFPGTGIGLATVQRIVRRHAGRVWAESRVGLGATFYFTIGETA